MKRLTMLLMILFLGCNPKIKYEKAISPVLYEYGKVVDTIHTQRHTDTDINVNFDMDGNLYVMPTSTTIPETWGVVFRCDHGIKFVIQGKGAKYKTLWDKLDPGMKVRIAFKEEYKVMSERDEEGKYHELERTLVDLDFIDANPVLEAEGEF